MARRRADFLEQSEQLMVKYKCGAYPMQSWLLCGSMGTNVQRGRH